MKKRLWKSGETIVETLVSMLIVSLTFLFLANAIVIAARFNNRIKTSEGEFRVTASGGSVISGDSFPKDGDIPVGEGLHVKVYRAYAGTDRDGNEIYYYYYTYSGS